MPASLSPSDANPATQARSRAAARITGGLLLILAAATLWPYYEVIGLWPVSRDATTWVLNGNPHADGWAEWVFRTRHFRVSYRPLTALSFTANYLLGGLAAWPYRATDLLLHAAAGWLTFALFRRLFTDAPRWLGALAALLVWGHPLADEIVPHLARRSYSLATAMSLAGLLLLLSQRATPGAKRGASIWWRSLAGGALLAAAILANETAIVAVVAAPLLLWHALPDAPRAAARVIWGALPAWVLAAVVVLARQAAIGGAGGYALDVDRIERIGPILAACLRSLLGLAPPAPGGAAPAWIGASVAVIMAVGGLAAIGHACARRFRFGSTRSLFVISIWLAGYLALYAMMGVWFPRQMYPVLPVLGLFAAGAIAWGLRRGGSHVRWVAAAPAAVMCVWLAWQSPVVRGPEPQRAAGWRMSNKVLRDLVAAVWGAPDVRAVDLVVPYFERTPSAALRKRDTDEAAMLGLRQPAVWAQAVLADRDIRLRPTLVFVQHPLHAEDGVRIEAGADDGVLVIPAGTIVYERRGAGFEKRMVSAMERLSLYELGATLDRERRLFIHDGYSFAFLSAPAGRD